MPKSSLSSKTKNAPISRTGHTAAKVFGQGAAAGIQEKGVKSGEGIDAGASS